MIEVTKVKTKKDVKEFIDFPLKLYKDNAYFVPPLYADEKALFKKKTVYSEQAESVFFIAKENGVTVGRIQGIIQRVANEKWKQKRVRFTRFDSIDDQRVADALFAAVENWAKENGMQEIVGPLGFSDLDREGLLVEGFDQISTFEEQYNYPYYQTLIENLGFEKEVDWVEHKLYAPEKIDPRYERISSTMMKKYGLKVGTAKNTRDFIKKYGDKFFDLLDKVYVDIYQSVPITPKMKKDLIKGFKYIVNVKYLIVILDKDENIVAFGITFPSIGKDLQKSGGKLTPKTIYNVLKTIKHPKVIDLGLVGIVPEYKNRAVASTIFNELMKMLGDGNLEYAETNLNLETNANIINQWKAFTVIRHKRRRSYVKKISV